MKIILHSVVFFIFFLANTTQAEMQKGMWEVSSNLKMNGMDLTGTANKHKTCMAHKDMMHFLKSATNGMKRNGKGCKLLDQQTTKNTYSWKMKCDSLLGMPGNVTAKGNFKLEEKSVIGEMIFTNKVLSVNIFSLSLVNRIEAKRMGDCKDKKKEDKKKPE